jgi:hypothetical protein
MSQYLLLIYPPAEGPPPGQLDRWRRYGEGLQEDGVLVTSGRLEGLHAATSVRVRDGETLISDGPFAETKEYLAGFYLLECEDLDAALAHAARMPVADYGTVEVRPLMFPVGTSVAEMENRAQA